VQKHDGTLIGLPEWWSNEQVAERYHTSPATVRYWKHIGKIRGSRFGKRTLYHRSEIERIDRELRDQIAS
jgi:DNA-binding transcriptional MerR regulator